MEHINHMNTQKIRFALVGCGAIGARHAAVLDAEKGTTLIALCDSNAGKAEALSKTYGDLPVYTDYEKMLKEISAEVVIIATPNGRHADMAIEAMERGFHVLVEKPMCLTETEGKRMIETARQREVKLMVVKQNRFNAAVAFATRAIAEGRLGKIFMIQANVLWNRRNEYYSESNWRGKKKEEGGALYTQASHFIDLMALWCGKVTETQAAIATKNHEIETEDCGSALLRFTSGALGTLTWTTCVYEKNCESSMTIIAEKGTVKIGGAYLNTIDLWRVEDYPLPKNAQFEDAPNHYAKYQGTSSNHDKVLREVIKELTTGEGAVVTGEEGLVTVAAIEKIYASAKDWS